MDGRSNKGRGRQRLVFVFVVVLLLVLLVMLAAGASFATTSSSPSPAGSPTAGETDGGSSRVSWVLVGVVAFVGAGWVVWLKRRNSGRR